LCVCMWAGSVRVRRGRGRAHTGQYRSRIERLSHCKHSSKPRPQDGALESPRKCKQGRPAEVGPIQTRSRVAMTASPHSCGLAAHCRLPQSDSEVPHSGSAPASPRRKVERPMRVYKLRVPLLEAHLHAALTRPSLSTAFPLRPPNLTAVFAVYHNARVCEEGGHNRGVTINSRPV